MQTIRVIIADDESLMRSGLRVFVDSAEGLEVVGEASDGEEAVRLAGELLPDVVLMDMQMPRMDGVDATRAVLAASPDTKVLAITTFSSERYLVPALQAGASAYLVKDTHPDDLVAAIHDVASGACVISPQVTRQLIASVRGGDESPATDDGESDLTDRELAVVQLLGEGLSNSEIAEQLFLSEATVKTHLGRVMAKWGVRDRVQTLIHAVRAGIVDLA